jgi:flagellar protein FliS
MNGIGSYQETAVLTQDKGKLIVMLYEGAIKFLKLGINEIEASNFEQKNTYFNKAWDIVNELNVSLDMDAGGEIAVNLRKLYSFILSHISTANIKNDQKAAHEVIDMLDELKQGWQVITS